jgi:hypothetical protein
MKGHRGSHYSPSRSLSANLVSRLALHSVDLRRCDGVDLFPSCSMIPRATGLQGSGAQHPVPLCSQNYEDKRRCMGRLTAGRLLDVELTPQLVPRY